MLLSVFGPPSAFTKWGVHVLHAMVDVALGEADYFAASDIGSLREIWQTRSTRHVFFYSDSPDRGILDVFLRTGAPILVLADDPGETTRFFMRERGIEWPWAVRLTSLCLSCVVDLVKSDASLLIQLSDRLSISDFLADASAQFGIELSPLHLLRIRERLGAGAAFDDPGSVAEAVARFATELCPEASAPPSAMFAGHVEALRRFHASYEPILRKSDVQDIQCPIELLIPGGRPDDIVDGGFDLVGPARHLFYGPYLHVPVGAWNVSMDVTVEDNLSGNRIDFDIYIGDDLIVESFDLPTSGAFRLLGGFVVEEPKQAVQFRLLLCEGAIEGRLEVRSIRIVRQ